MVNKPTSAYPGSPFASQPPLPTTGGFSISYPAQHILLCTLEREKAMNSIPFALHWHLHALFHWFDREPELRVAIITGAGKKSFCAGQDLIELGKRQAAAKAKAERGEEASEDEKVLELVRANAGHPPTGFAGISRRVGKKPIIAAVNGFALGGGFEIVLNW
jgi:enoyl-CoA hydratase/carnithine racemase